MSKRLELTGKKFGRLNVVHYSKTDKGWICNCDCGNCVTINTNNLTSGKSKSCGCLRKEITAKRMKQQNHANKKKVGEGSMSCLINRYKFDAKKRELEWNLTREQFKLLTSSDCVYCGVKPSRIIKGARSNGEYLFNGIDRIDSNLGYIPTNTVSCCEKCNYAKREMSFNEFKEWIERVFFNLKGEV